MEPYDERVDAYIARAADFAQPILKHLRQLIHQACPDIRETIKWGFPHFEEKGTICSFASFKQHCSLTFSKASLMKDEYGIMERVGKTAMGQFGQIRSMSDLPADEILTQYLQEARQLNEQKAKITKPKAEKKELQIPEYFISALKADPVAFRTFSDFSYSHQKEYVEWVTEAKTEATREKRLITTLEWLAEGKRRMWKYTK
jgi:uncharacterized protein YdeI (YjbR/CyaY-like superfamily)